MSSAAKAWWQDAAIYQIYVRSFQDSDGDGVGDLPGITSRLDYLRWLGVDAIWLTPFYPSPMEDFGYDITDYCDVDPRYGTLADFDHLLCEAHRRDIRVIVDYVPNHTSHLHPWFQESRRSRTNAKRDWYIWGDSKPDGSPPNNWRGQGGGRNDAGGGWVWDEHTGQWYLANFSPAQPELNWSNPAVRAEMLVALEFWLKRGVDGVRIDMVDFLGKDPELRDELAAPPGTHPRDQIALATMQLNRPETLDYIGAIRQTADRYGEKVLIGETIYHLPLDRFAHYHGNGQLLHLPTNFRLTFLPVEADAIRDWVDAYDAGQAWPNYCLGNHDSPRVARHGEPVARLLTMLLLTLRGTPFLYYGDEIGMPPVDIPAEQTQDHAWAGTSTPSRDPARTPMQWDDGRTAGFCPSDVEPWLPLGADHVRRNVACLRGDPGSILELTRQLLRLRRSFDGDYAALDDHPPGMYVYRRGEDVIIALNFTEKPATVQIPLGARLLLSTDPDRVDVDATLAPFEGIVLQTA